MSFMRFSESGRISIDSTRRPPTAAEISCTFGAPTAKKKTSILLDLKSSEARITFTVGTCFTSFIVRPPAASSALRCVMTLVCCTQSVGMFLPFRSAMDWIGESLRTQNAIWKPYRLIARRRFGFGLPFQTFSPFIASAGSPTSSSRKSACFEFTASMMPLSPPCPITRTCSFEWSCTTLAMTEACALSSVPGCRVAKPTVCWPSASVENAASATAQSVLKCMNPSSKRGRESTVLYCGDAAEGPHCLFRDRRPSGAQAAGRCARRGLDHRQRRRVVHRAQHAAHGSSSALWTAAAARPAELGVARVRHARGLLAFSRSSKKAPAQSDAGDQRLGAQVLSARRAGGEGCGLGIHGAWLDPAADASCRGSAKSNQRHRRRDQGIHRQGAEGLGKSRPDGNQ